MQHSRFNSAGSPPIPYRGAYSAPQTPTWFKGPTSTGEGRERGKEGKGDRPLMQIHGSTPGIDNDQGTNRIVRSCVRSCS